MLAVGAGRVPGFVVNPGALDHPRLRAALHADAADLDVGVADGVGVGVGA